MKRPPIPAPEAILTTQTLEFPKARGTKPVTPVRSQPNMPQAKLPPIALSQSPLIQNPSVHTAIEEPTHEPLYLGTAYRIGTLLSDADKHAEYNSVQLPSGFAPYPFKRLNSKLVNGLTQAKFTKAANEGSLRTTVEAVTSRLGDGINAMDLSIGDFQYLMYWLRFNSYTKQKFTYPSICNNEEHRKAVLLKTKAPETLRSMHVLERTEIVEMDFTSSPTEQEAKEMLAPYGLLPTHARTFDMVELLEKRDDIFEGLDEKAPQALLEKAEATYIEYSYLADLASMVMGIDKPLTLTERIDIVGNMTPDDIVTLKQYRKEVTQYGVQEFVNVRCKECGAEQRTEVSVSASDFL